MPSGFTVQQVRGEWAKASAELERQGRRELRAQLRKIISAETKPARIKLRDATREALPKGGGISHKKGGAAHSMSRWAGVMPSLSIHESGSNVGATVKLGKKGHDFKALNRGRLRHPVFGRRTGPNDWWNQSVESGWWDRAKDLLEPQIRQGVSEALHKYIDDVSRKAG